VFHNNDDFYTTGPGDIIALMGIAVETKLDVYCYVPPHDDAQKWSANIVYKCMQFRCCTELRKKAMVYWLLGLQITVTKRPINALIKTALILVITL
jgi:hypothetical protein